MSSGNIKRADLSEAANPAVVEILASADVWDMTLPWLPIYWDISVLARYKRAGYTFVSATLQDWPPTMDGTRRCIDRFKELAKAHESWLSFGSSLAEIEIGRQEGKLVIGFNSQESRLIAEDLSRVEEVYALGVRHMVLAYNVRNLVADGCAEMADAGLSNFGRRLVREMNRVGVVVDCSHTGCRSSIEAIEMSERPVIFSHSNAYAVWPHFRNARDEQIKACAASGGVIGIVGVGAFLGDAAARTESMFRHIDYVAGIVGAEHVGLGTDYVDILPVQDHRARWAAVGASLASWPDPANEVCGATDLGLTIDQSHCFQPEQVSALIELMLTRGYSTNAVKGILGGNFRRVYAAAGRDMERGGADVQAAQ